MRAADTRFRWSGDYLSVALLDAVASDLAKQIPPGTARFNFTMHSVIIRYFLGDEWFKEHLLPNARHDSFLRPDFEKQDVDPRFSVLTLELAENLLNLQTVQGFRTCLDHMAVRQMQSGLCELQIGHVLRSRGVPFRYVDEGEPTTVDLILQTQSGDEGLGEIKCKYEGAEYSKKTLRGALERARKQIGKGNEGVVFVKLPSAWLKVVSRGGGDPPQIILPAEIVATAKDQMRQASRIKKVIFYVFHHMCDPARGLGVTHATMEMTSSRLTEGSPWRAELLSGSGPWTTMQELSRRWT
ncbi:hypothetical protein [Brevundimonas sp.]|uniref:hypothetical protein n=1 Tax=Brevundimonas sp. TaxID=1871086 RepID=UPI00289C72C2|nr:hypothetical protein [Brevundimonas sp.]